MSRGIRDLHAGSGVVMPVCGGEVAKLIGQD